MKTEQEYCHFCGGKLYLLASSHAKCSLCTKKYSLKKAAFDRSVIEGFCENKSAHSLSKELNVTYLRVHTRYHQLRMIIMQNFSEISVEPNEYEEYLYSPNKRRSDTIDGFNFITFSTQTQVYNYLLPPLRRFYRYKDSTELSSFIRKSHIAKLSHAKNKITEFWNFFEDFMKHFKGVNKDNFAFYLKEAEFKFNHTKEEQLTLLLSLWYKR